MPMGIEMLGSVESTAIRRERDVGLYRMLSPREMLCVWEGFEFSKSESESESKSRTRLHAPSRPLSVSGDHVPQPPLPRASSQAQSDDNHRPQCRNVVRPSRGG